MIIAITGTPGTGKTSISNSLKKKGYDIVDINKTVVENNFVIGFDIDRDTKIIDLEKLDKYIFKNFSKKEILFIDGHLSHLLKNVDKIILLRCQPDVLRKRLKNKKWSEKKVEENIEAEVLDVILCESVDIHRSDNVFEINTTNLKTDEIVGIIEVFVENGFKPSIEYRVGSIDWSEEFV